MGSYEKKTAPYSRLHRKSVLSPEDGARVRKMEADEFKRAGIDTRASLLGTGAASEAAEKLSSREQKIRKALKDAGG